MSDASGGQVDPRTDRAILTTVAYGTGDLLADRAQIYRFVTPQQEPMHEWLFGLVGGAGALAEPVVDIGAGNGDYVLALGGRRAVALDLSLGMLEGIRAKGFAGPVVRGDAQALPVRDSVAGTALANHMLYHLPDIGLGARELRRILRPGGVLLAVTNGADHLHELRGLLDEAVGDVVGERFHFTGSAERFRLEDGAEVLSTAFDRVERHDRLARMVVPESEPVMRYLASLRGVASLLPEGVAFDEVLTAAARRVAASLAEGPFEITVHTGAFVCD